MNYPYIPEEVIRSGYITLYADDTYTFEKDVEAYNNYIAECRVSRKQAENIRMGYCISNLLTLITLILCDFETVFYRGALSYSMLAIYVISFVMFAVIKSNLIFAAAVSPVLLVLDILFISLIIANALFAFLYEKIDRPLRDHITYPVFYTIDIRYSRSNRPKEHTFRE